jgi:hypothetical protein
MGIVSFGRGRVICAFIIAISAIKLKRQKEERRRRC